ncbi:Hypothetical protein D9617_1g083470 [Elsinoe fawcettii]|nr:Hypothetical protein D9617_1g083470 [Elsinoe fawcettii]
MAGPTKGPNRPRQVVYTPTSPNPMFQDLMRRVSLNNRPVRRSGPTPLEQALAAAKTKPAALPSAEFSPATAEQVSKKNEVQAAPIARAPSSSRQQTGETLAQTKLSVLSRISPNRNREVSGLGMWFPPTATADGQYASQYPDSAIQIYTGCTVLFGHSPKPQHTGGLLVEPERRATRQSTKKAASPPSGEPDASAETPPGRSVGSSTTPKLESSLGKRKAADLPTTAGEVGMSITLKRLKMSGPGNASAILAAAPAPRPTSNDHTGKRKHTDDVDGNGNHRPKRIRPAANPRDQDPAPRCESPRRVSRRRGPPSSSPDPVSSDSDWTDTTEITSRIVVLPAYINVLGRPRPQRHRLRPVHYFIIPFAVRFVDGRAVRLPDPAPTNVQVNALTDFQIFTRQQLHMWPGSRLASVAAEPQSPLSEHSIGELDDLPSPDPKSDSVFRTQYVFNKVSLHDGKLRLDYDDLGSDDQERAKKGMRTRRQALISTNTKGQAVFSEPKPKTSLEKKPTGLKYDVALQEERMDVLWGTYFEGTRTQIRNKQDEHVANELRHRYGARKDFEGQMEFDGRNMLTDNQAQREVESSIREEHKGNDGQIDVDMEDDEDEALYLAFQGIALRTDRDQRATNAQVEFAEQQKKEAAKKRRKEKRDSSDEDDVL